MPRLRSAFSEIPSAIEDPDPRCLGTGLQLARRRLGSGLLLRTSQGSAITDVSAQAKPSLQVPVWEQLLRDRILSFTATLIAAMAAPTCLRVHGCGSGSFSARGAFENPAPLSPRSLSAKPAVATSLGTRRLVSARVASMRSSAVVEVRIDPAPSGKHQPKADRRDDGVP